MTDQRPGCICVNGCFFEPHEATVSVFDSGFLLGDGLFESLRAVEGVPYLLDQHLMRLYAAAATLEFARMPRRETITEQVYRALQRSGLADAYVRVTITRGSGAIGLSPPEGSPTVVIAVLPAPVRTDADHGIKVTLLHQQRERRVTAKSTSWQPAVLARRCVDQRGADEGIYVSDNGHVLEGVASNVFAIEGSQLVTPRVADCLPGITRARILELAGREGIAVIEAQLEVQALMHAEAVFVTNAVQGLRTVCAIDGTDIGKPGAEEIFGRLYHLYEEDRMSVVGVAR
jgi:branched-subunit amino acid aminotransferase/4-amino-4-deoxychorismate lyase